MGGLGRISIFRGGLLGKRGVTFSEGLKFLDKKQTKSGIFYDKKVYKQCFVLSLLIIQTGIF